MASSDGSQNRITAKILAGGANHVLDIKEDHQPGPAEALAARSDAAKAGKTACREDGCECASAKRLPRLPSIC